jgi:hypothetical protein
MNLLVKNVSDAFLKRFILIEDRFLNPTDKTQNYETYCTDFP